jgi:hypothetical protein
VERIGRSEAWEGPNLAQVLLAHSTLCVERVAGKQANQGCLQAPGEKQTTAGQRTAGMVGNGQILNLLKS